MFLLFLFSFDGLTIVGMVQLQLLGQSLYLLVYLVDLGYLPELFLEKFLRGILELVIYVLISKLICDQIVKNVLLKNLLG